jgi:hypothetical protein
LKNGGKGISVDLRANDDVDCNIVIKTSDSVEEVLGVIGKEHVERVDAVYCVAGSWQGGSIASTGAIKQILS